MLIFVSNREPQPPFELSRVTDPCRGAVALVMAELEDRRRHRLIWRQKNPMHGYGTILREMAQDLGYRHGRAGYGETARRPVYPFWLHQVQGLQTRVA